MRRSHLLPLAVILLAGCRPTPLDLPTEAPPAPPVEPGSAFDPARCGTVVGRVTWAGEIPMVPMLDPVIVGGAMQNPHTPAIDPKTRGLAGAVVFLRGLDPAAGRPWDLPPARVDITPLGISVLQGDRPPQRVGFVKRGAEVSMVSSSGGPLMLRTRGAAFFTLAFPDPGKPLSRRFERPGVVELSSGSGQFWAAADLFVCDHPYYVVTDPDGKFTLPLVPAGDHELVAWVRDWHLTGKDRDPESGLVVRLHYATPVEKRTAVRVEPGITRETAVSVGAADFASP